MTQTQRILAYLKSGRTLTPIQALRKFKTFRLAARVAEIRQLGHNVKTEMVDGHARYRMA